MASSVGTSQNPRPPVIPSNVRRALVVDDEPEIRDLICKFLSKESIETQTAENGKEALSFAEKEDFDLILSDITMPEMNGLEFLNSLRSKGRNTPVVFVTAYTNTPNTLEALRLGATDFVSKPFRQGTLLEAVTRAFHKHDRDLETDQQIHQLQKLALVGEMSAGLAHEISTPLMLLQGRMHRLKKLVDDQSEIAAQIKKAENDIERVGKILKSLKAFSRETHSDPFETISVRSLIDDAISLCSDRFKTENVRLDADYGPEGLEAVCRPSEAAQILLNLFSNALDATEGLTERTVRVHVAELKAERRYSKKNPSKKPQSSTWVEIHVEDPGPGISAEMVDKLFHSFATTKKPGKGTGLGLRISKRLAELQGGDLFLDRAASPTRFILTLRAKS
ncbi:MAG: response regulator [Bdellovibrionales bacterium]|nr:response regulator [Bdellovibrionales bacterium]